MHLLNPEDVTARLKVGYHESVEMIRAAEDLDQILLALVFAARHFLDPIHLYALRQDTLICQLALDQQALTDVQQRALPLTDSPLVSRVATKGILYLGPIPKAESNIKFFPTKKRSPKGIGVLPIVIKGRTLFVLLGYLLIEPSRQVLEDLAMLGTETAMAIASLIIRNRKEKTPATEEAGDTSAGLKRVDTSLQRPAKVDQLAEAATDPKPTLETRLNYNNHKAGTTHQRPKKFSSPKSAIPIVSVDQVQPPERLKRVGTNPMWPQPEAFPRQDTPATAGLAPPRITLSQDRGAARQPQSDQKDQVFELITPKRKYTPRVPRLANTPAVTLQPEYLSAEPTDLNDVVELLYPKSDSSSSGPAKKARHTSPTVKKSVPAPKGKHTPAPANPSQPARTASPSDRMHVRFPLEVEVSYSSDHNFFTGFMENISDGGIFVATYASFEIGERLELVFTLPGISGWCTTVCEVRWIREFNPDLLDAIPGMGLRFIDLDKRLIPAIEKFARVREPIFYED